MPTPALPKTSPRCVASPASSVAIINQLPFQGGSWNTSLAITAEPEAQSINGAQYMVGENALKTLGVKLVAGRDFNADEYQSSDVLEKVEDLGKLEAPAILTEAMAKQFFPDGNAVGKTLYMANIPVTVVGVAQTLLRPNMQDNNRTLAHLSDPHELLQRRPLYPARHRGRDAVTKC